MELTPVSNLWQILGKLTINKMPAKLADKKCKGEENDGKNTANGKPHKKMAGTTLAFGLCYKNCGPRMGSRTSR
jgi:hypothetical protein